jgi:hypothetical protein
MYATVKDQRSNGLKVKSLVKAGGLAVANHNRALRSR